MVSLVCWCSLYHEAIVKERFGEAVFITMGMGDGDEDEDDIRKKKYGP